MAFERQEITPALIKSDYWETPDATSSLAVTTQSTTDQRGLTGSARLLQDIYQLDQYAFETDRRKPQLTKVISVAQMSPLELQRLHETGVIVFATPMELFDRDFPGHYLRLIKQVRTSVIALIPPTHGIKATFSTTGASKVVIGGDLFQTVNVSRGPESVALSAPFNATGLFELNRVPAGDWRASNPGDLLWQAAASHPLSAAWRDPCSGLSLSSPSYFDSLEVT